MGLILTKLVSVPTESNPIRLYMLGFTMEGRLTWLLKRRNLRRRPRRNRLL